MRVVGALWHLMWFVMMWKSISLIGWEYLVMLRGIRFESYVCQLYVILKCVILMLCLHVISDNVILKL